MNTDNKSADSTISTQTETVAAAQDIALVWADVTILLNKIDSKLDALINMQSKPSTSRKTAAVKKTEPVAEPKKKTDAAKKETKKPNAPNIMNYTKSLWKEDPEFKKDLLEKFPRIAEEIEKNTELCTKKDRESATATFVYNVIKTNKEMQEYVKNKKSESEKQSVEEDNDSDEEERVEPHSPKN